MFDASVKSPVGVEYGVEYQFGNFDQCMEIKTSQNDDGVDIQPKYCLVDVALDGYVVRKIAKRNHQVRFGELWRQKFNTNLLKIALAVPRIMMSTSHANSKFCWLEISITYCDVTRGNVSIKRREIFITILIYFNREEFRRFHYKIISSTSTKLKFDN